MVQMVEVEGLTYTTICLRASRRLVMNLRVRMVTWESAMFAVVDGGEGGLSNSQ